MRDKEPIRLYDLEPNNKSEWAGRFILHPNVGSLELVPVRIESKGQAYYYFVPLPRKIRDLVYEYQEGIE